MEFCTLGDSPNLLRLKVQYKEREQYELKERVKMVKELGSCATFPSRLFEHCEMSRIHWTCL